MNDAPKIAWDDMILPFQLDQTHIRGRVARLDDTLDRILTQHDYPAPVQALVADMVLLTALIGQTIKLRWKLSFQVRGEGAVKLIATDYFAPKKEGEPAEIRAYAAYDADAVPTRHDTPFELIGGGLFGVLIDQGNDMRPYQGITPLTGGSLAACAQTYFAQSEQLPTSFVLRAALSAEPGEDAKWRGGGIMIQKIPKSSAPDDQDASSDDGLLSAEDILNGDEAEDWSRTKILLETVEITEMIGPHVDPQTLLLRLFHEEAPRVYDAQPVRFGCTCSREKVENVVNQYTPEEIASAVTEAGVITADCQFCGMRYEFDPKCI